MADDGAMSPNPWPVPTPFEPGAGFLPPALEVLADRAGRIPALLLVAGARARPDGWAARAATKLASTLGEEGLRIVLAEISADEPELHEELGVPNDEGMADVFLFGASLRRVARAVSGRTFYFAPAGAYVPDPEALLSHPRWERLIGGFVEAEAVLILYVPADTPGLDALARRAGHAVILAGADEADAVAGTLPDACGIDAVLTPPEPDAAAGVSPVGREGPAARPLAEDVEDDAAGPEAEPVDAVFDGGIDLGPEDETPESPFDAGMEPAAVDDHGEFAEPIDGVDEPAESGDLAGLAEFGGPPDPADAEAADRAASSDADDASDLPEEDDLIRELAAIHRESESRRWRFLLLGAILVVVVAVAGWFVYGRSGDDAATSAPADSAADASEAPEASQVSEAAVQPARPIDSPIPYSVVIESHQALGSAQEAVDRLRAEEPDIGFYLAPVEVEDVVYFRVLAGPASDSAAARALMLRLVDLGLKEEAQPWAVRNTAQAFRLADFDTRDAARARVAELAEDGVPTYVLEVPFTAGPSRFRLYAGAYRNEAEASVMAQILSEHGLDVELVRRIGRPAT